MAPAHRKLWLTASAALGVIAVLPIAGALHWRWSSLQAFTRLNAHASTQPGHFSDRCLTGLPAPVARYFSRVLRDGQPFASRVELMQDAEFFVGGGWHPLTATQHFTTSPPGFVWNAKIGLAPFVPVFVRDSYVDRTGAMRASLTGVYAIVNQHDRRELDRGALLRYLAEAVWFPTALLPDAGVSWQAVDDKTAVAWLTDGPTTVSLRFHFNAAGDVEIMEAPDRPREVNGEYIATPWIVRCTDYENVSGMRIPVQCEVAWQLPGTLLTYWRGRIADIRYDDAR
jgi:hypothetical protein